jgi:hypothetical protein
VQINNSIEVQPQNRTAREEKIITLLNKRISWQVICKSNKINDGKRAREQQREEEKANEIN